LQVVGALKVVSQTADSFPLYLGELRFVISSVCKSSIQQVKSQRPTMYDVNLVLVPTGLNVVGRGSSSQADHQGLLDKWKGEHPGIPVHGTCLA
jgi:hypothetical protein